MKLTQQKVNRSKKGEKDQILRDDEVPALYFRQCKTGGQYYYIQYTSPVTGQKRKKFKLINTNGLPLPTVRAIALELLGRIARGEDPAETNKAKQQWITLAAAIDLYEPWVLLHRKAGKQTLSGLRTFRTAKFWNKRVNEITAEDLADWQTDMLQTPTKRNTINTINKKLTMLRAALHTLVEIGKLPEFELKFPAKMPETDSKVRERYLSQEERKVLLSETAKLSKEYPYFLPAIVLSLNTGIRQGTLRQLLWTDVQLIAKPTLTLRAAIMKGSKRAVISLNQTVTSCLCAWRQTAPESPYIIANSDGTAVSKDELDSRWDTLVRRTKIKDLTWHCMRHDFASQLVMAGISLGVVKELMCHSSIAMTERYAHLAPTMKATAVSELDKL